MFHTRIFLVKFNILNQLELETVWNFLAWDFLKNNQYCSLVNMLWNLISILIMSFGDGLWRNRICDFMWTFLKTADTKNPSEVLSGVRREILDLWRSFYVIIFILVSVYAEIDATLKFKSENLVIFAMQRNTTPLPCPILKADSSLSWWLCAVFK